mmetsp:Transcript_2502/g.3681  ORF Transcript_2502/g.3681 Transcript_2502/m.3681 type:complete len:210 (+) Transcript_2502:979-1608(+)
MWIHRVEPRKRVVCILVTPLGPPTVIQIVTLNLKFLATLLILGQHLQTPILGCKIPSILILKRILQKRRVILEIVFLQLTFCRKTRKVRTRKKGSTKGIRVRRSNRKIKNEMSGCWPTMLQILGQNLQKKQNQCILHILTSKQTQEIETNWQFPNRHIVLLASVGIFTIKMVTILFLRMTTILFLTSTMLRIQQEGWRVHMIVNATQLY